MSFRNFSIVLAALALTAADAPPLAALATLQPGRWELMSHDGDFSPRSVCIGDPRLLLQLRQPSAVCTHFIIANEASHATVHYNCTGAGHGQTTVRVETPRLAQIDTQGLVGNAPFDFTIEARRTGECGTATLR